MANRSAPLIPKTEEQFEKRFTESLERLRPKVIHLWQVKWKIVKVNVIIGIFVAATLLLFAKPYYKGVITIVPDYGNKSLFDLGALSDLASLAGVTVGQSTPTQIYENLLESESVLGPVIYAKYKTDKFVDSVNLIEYFDIQPDTWVRPENRERKMFLEAYQTLTESIVKTEVEKLTYILNVSVTTHESKLTANVANNISESLDNYVRTKRKSFASNQRFYIEKRVNEVKDSLRTAEEKLKIFRLQNRVLAQSPTLVLAEARLARDVDVLNVVFVELTKQLELSKIDEIRDTPIINVKEPVGDPVIKEGPKRVFLFIIMMFFSFTLTCVYYIFESRIKTYIRLIKGK
jgi:uncharacterized protein involved in exopolysaccharide biosynthesis